MGRRPENDQTVFAAFGDVWYEYVLLGYQYAIVFPVGSLLRGHQPTCRKEEHQTLGGTSFRHNFHIAPYFHMPVVGPQWENQLIFLHTAGSAIVGKDARSRGSRRQEPRIEKELRKIWLRHRMKSWHHHLSNFWTICGRWSSTAGTGFTANHTLQTHNLLEGGYKPL